MPVKERKIEKMFYTMGEVAAGIGENISLVRFWADKFPELFKPQRNKKGNRLFSSEEYQKFHRLHHLVKDRGLKLESAAQIIKGSGDANSNRKDEVIRKLTNVKKMLENIVDSM